jgi:hypothetical protein
MLRRLTAARLPQNRSRAYALCAVLLQHIFAVAGTLRVLLSQPQKRHIQSTALPTLTHQYALLPIILYYIRIYVKPFTHLSSLLPTITHYSLNNMLSFLLSYLLVAPNKHMKINIFRLTDIIKNTPKCSL